MDCGKVNTQCWGGGFAFRNMGKRTVRVLPECRNLCRLVGLAEHSVRPLFCANFKTQKILVLDTCFMRVGMIRGLL
jgi:hypothetical protein